MNATFKKWLRRAGLALLALVAIGASALALGAHLGERKMQRRVELAVADVPLRSDPASIERGRYLYLSRGCTECHAVNGGGKDVINDGNGMHVRAPNITPGPGNVVAGYRSQDWLRTIRHGVKPDGRPAIVMPSEDYARMTDDDVASLVAYLRQMAPVDAPGAIVQMPAMVRALYAVGVIHDAAETIDHAAPASMPVAEAVTVEHGAYVLNSCIGCHGTKLSGGKIPGTPPDWPAAANLTPGEGSAMAHYPTPEAFAAMFKSGKRPDGTEVSQIMPFASLKELNDTDVRALYLRLKTLPPVAAGNR